MYKILITSIENYIDGSCSPKIQANVSAYWCERIVPGNMNEGEGILLSTLSIAFDAFTVASIIDKSTIEEAKISLNNFVISEAQKNSLMSMKYLQEKKAEIDAKENARIISQSIIDMINPIVKWPARIDCENPDIIQKQISESETGV